MKRVDLDDLQHEYKISKNSVKLNGFSFSFNIAKMNPWTKKLKYLKDKSFLNVLTFFSDFI